MMPCAMPAQNLIFLHYLLASLKPLCGYDNKQSRRLCGWLICILQQGLPSHKNNPQSYFGSTLHLQPPLPPPRLCSFCRGSHACSVSLWVSGSSMCVRGTWGVLVVAGRHAREGRVFGVVGVEAHSRATATLATMTRYMITDHRHAPSKQSNNSRSTDNRLQPCLPSFLST